LADNEGLAKTGKNPHFRLSFLDLTHEWPPVRITNNQPEMSQSIMTSSLLAKAQNGAWSFPQPFPTIAI
jgi:hypothetical protein